MSITAVTEAELLERAVEALPTNWFSPDETAPGGSLYPLMVGLNKGDASNMERLLILQTQLYIGTAYGVGLDNVARDFFGDRITRKPNETDAAFRTRILSALFLPAATRAGLISAVQRGLNRTPTVVEPADIDATGGWSDGVHAYGPFRWGGGGMYLTPPVLAYQAFVTVQRQPVGDPYYLSDSDIYKLIDSVRPTSATFWVRIID